jgi:uncharacterized protein involved in exopolysaccharide biosynthesis
VIVDREAGGPRQAARPPVAAGWPDTFGPPEQGIDLIVTWIVLKRYKVFIALCTVACVLGASIYAFMATPMFRAEAAITEAHDSNLQGNAPIAGQLGGIASLAGLALGVGGGQGREALATLKSRRLAELFITRYGLKDRLLARTRGPRTMWHAVALFRKDVLNVDEDRKTGVTTISMYWTSPTEAAQWANDYIALSNEVMRNRAADDARRNIDYLTNQLRQTASVEVQRALNNLVESETKTLMLAGRADYAFATIDPAVPPELKASPKRVIIILVALVAGLFAGLLIAIARYKVALYSAYSAHGDRGVVGPGRIDA